LTSTTIGRASSVVDAGMIERRAVAACHADSRLSSTRIHERAG
jgi:hypothetical protein